MKAGKLPKTPLPSTFSKGRQNRDYCHTLAEKSRIRDLLWQLTDLNPDPEVLRMRCNGGERHHGSLSQELIPTFLDMFGFIQKLTCMFLNFLCYVSLNRISLKQTCNGYFTSCTSWGEGSETLRILGFAVLTRSGSAKLHSHASLLAMWRSWWAGIPNFPTSGLPCAVLSVIMSFCFNFDVPAQTTNRADKDGNESQNGKKDSAAKCVSNVSEPIMWCRLSYSKYSTGAGRPAGTSMVFIERNIESAHARACIMSWGLGGSEGSSRTLSQAPGLVGLDLFLFFVITTLLLHNNNIAITSRAMQKIPGEQVRPWQHHNKERKTVKLHTNKCR